MPKRYGWLFPRNRATILFYLFISNFYLQSIKIKMENETIKPREAGMSDTNPKAMDSGSGIPGPSRDFLWDRRLLPCA